MILFAGGLVMTDMTTITIELPLETEHQIAALAEATGRSGQVLLLEAVHRYFDLEAWQVAQIHTAIAEADAGHFATDVEMQAVFDRGAPAR